LAHLRLHVFQADDVALVVMAHLAGEIDGVGDFDRLRLSVFFLPHHPKTFRLFADSHSSVAVDRCLARYEQKVSGTIALSQAKGLVRIGVDRDLLYLHSSSSDWKIV
jgi:hypothetical protein